LTHTALVCSGIGAKDDPGEENPASRSLVRAWRIAAARARRASAAGAPIHAPDVVRAVMIDKGLDPADRQSFARVQWKVRDTLKSLNKRGLLVPDGVGHGVLWRIADHAA